MALPGGATAIRRRHEAADGLRECGAVLEHARTEGRPGSGEPAAGGHTNRRIAGLLDISVTAVERHLHQSCRTLDIQRPGQLAKALGA